MSAVSVFQLQKAIREMNFLRFILFLVMYVSVSKHLHMWVQVPSESRRGRQSSCELTDLGASNWTWVLSKTSTHFWMLPHFCSLKMNCPCYFFILIFHTTYHIGWIPLHEGSEEKSTQRLCICMSPRRTAKRNPGNSERPSMKASSTPGWTLEAEMATKNSQNPKKSKER